MPRRTWYKTLNAPAFMVRRPATAGMEAYATRRSGVPLQGGQAQGFIPAGSASGSLTSPGTFNSIASLAVTQPGPVLVSWTVTLGGTVGAGDASNFILVNATTGATVAVSSNAGAAGTYPQTAVTVTGPAVMVIKTGGNAPTAGSVYSGTVSVAVQALTLQIGPQGAGTVWYPAQVTTSTTSGVNDTSTCLVYMGAAGTPITLMGTLFPGGAGVLATAFPPLTVGLFVIAAFSSGKPGDVAAVNVTGTMDYLDAAGPL